MRHGTKDWRAQYLTSLVKRKQATAIKRYALRRSQHYTDALETVIQVGLEKMNLAKPGKEKKNA